MITVTKTMTTETAHRLIDFVGKCASIHGHSYKWEVTAMKPDGDTASNGIAIDFGDLKAAMREYIYNVFDHALVLAHKDPIVLTGNLLHLEMAADGAAQKILIFPGNPTAENFAIYVAADLRRHFIAQEVEVDVIRVRVWET